MQDVEMNDVEEDEVVKEIDVYISQNLAGDLSIFQYPLRQPWRKYPMSKLSEVKYRPQHQKLELEFHPETSSEYYNDESDVKPTMTTLSSSSMQLKTNYAIGVFRKDEIHLTPLQNIYQFRPSFAYLDAADEQRKKEQKKDEKEEEETPQPTDPGEGEFRTAAPRPVQMQYRINPSKASANQRQTIAQLKKNEEEEPWQSLKFYDDDAEETQNELEKLFDTSKVPTVPDVAAKSYLPQLCPPSADVVQVPAGQTKVNSMETIKLLPMEAQIREIIRIAQIMHFGKLRELAVKAKPLDLLPNLEKVAVFVRGRWVAKSDLCCTGALIVAREYMLLLFSKNEIVSRKEVQQATGVSAEVLRELLSRIAVMDAARHGWRLRLDEDEHFVDLHPDYPAKSASYWLKNESRILAQVHDLKQGKYKPAVGDASSTSAALPASVYRGSEEALAQLHKFFKDTFTRYGVCNYILIRSTWLAAVKNTDTENKLNEIDDDTFKSVMNELTMQVQNVYVLKHVNPETDKFRDVILGEFKKHMSIKRSEVAQKCKEVLKVDVPANVLKSILKQLAITSGTHQWIFKDGNGNQIN